MVEGERQALRVPYGAILKQIRSWTSSPCTDSIILKVPLGHPSLVDNAQDYSSSSIPHTLLTTIRLAPARRAFSQSAIRSVQDPKMPSGPPKHEMAYFPEMTSALPSKSGEFRRVLWTGLYSQVVLMTVPVDGEIGDEVGSSFCTARLDCFSAAVRRLIAVSVRFIPSIKP